MFFRVFQKLISIIFVNHLILNFPDGQRVSRGEPIVGESKPSGSAGSRSSWTSILTGQVTTIVCVCLIQYMPQLQAGWNNQLWEWMQMSTTSSSRLCLFTLYDLSLKSTLQKVRLLESENAKVKETGGNYYGRKKEMPFLCHGKKVSNVLRSIHTARKQNFLWCLNFFSLISFACYRPQTKFGARQYFQKRVSRILSTGGMVSQHALQVISQHALQVSRAVSQHALRHTPPLSRRLLLRAARILLECIGILVLNLFPFRVCSCSVWTSP